jgi:hypothetical protein
MALTVHESMLPSRAVSGEFHMEHACSGHGCVRMRCPLPYGVESASYLKTGYSHRGFLLKTRFAMLEPPS